MGESQFRRLEKKLSALPTLWAELKAWGFLRRSGRLGKGAELKAWGVVWRNGRLGECRTEGFGCGKAEWKARGRQKGFG